MAFPENTNILDLDNEKIRGIQKDSILVPNSTNDNHVFRMTLRSSQENGEKMKFWFWNNNNESLIELLPIHTFVNNESNSVFNPIFLYDQKSLPEPEPAIDCLTSPTIVNVISVNNSNKYVLNGGNQYDSELQYGLTEGTYVFSNIPSSHSLAIYQGDSNISYNGDPSKKTVRSVNGIDYNFFYGDMEVVVSGNFGTASLYCLNHGYMGGKDVLIYSSGCPVPVVEESEPESIFEVVFSQNESNFTNFLEYKNVIMTAFDKWDSLIIGAKNSSIRRYFKINVTVSFQQLDSNILGGAYIESVYNAVNLSNYTSVPISQVNSNYNFGVNLYPHTGTFIINSSLIETLKNQTRPNGDSNLYTVSLHEIAHLLGIGTLWGFGYNWSYETINTPIISYQENDSIIIME
jgi:hypothetical protein